MRTLELNLLGTLAVATALFFLGQLIARCFFERTSVAADRSGNP